MSLISIAVYDTEQNGRTELTRQCLSSIEQTVNFDRHRLFLIDNNSCDSTQALYEEFKSRIPFTLIKNSTNIGTARSVNRGWLNRKEGECCAKVDNDIKFNTKNWADMLEDGLSKDHNIVVLGCKRRDCWEHDKHENEWWRSQLQFLPHIAGDKWYVIEVCNHIIGSALMYSSEFLKDFGYMYQGDFLYGYDDAISSARVHAAKKFNAFLHGIDIEHLDSNGKESNLYSEWKQKYSGERMEQYSKLANEYLEGRRPIYQGPEDE